MRIATFNLENLDSGNTRPPIETRIEILRPQLQRIDADVLCLQEVHAQGPSGNRTLDALDQLIAQTQYANGYHRATTSTVAGGLYRYRNLVTLSRLPIRDMRIFRDTDGPRPSYQPATAVTPDPTPIITWERPILHTELELDTGESLHVLNLHMKSKMPSFINGQVNNSVWTTRSAWAEGSFLSSMKRVGQAIQTRLLVDELFDAHGASTHIVVVGDFNAEAREVPVKAICGHIEETANPDHAPRVLIPCENNIPDSARYSLFHLGQGAMLDHILASRSMFRFFDHAEIHNEALPDESGAFRFDTHFPDSDHAPVVAEFSIP